MLTDYSKYDNIISEREVNTMKEKTFVIRVFDGKNTTIYTTRDTDIRKAESRIIDLHYALGGDVLKVTVTEQRS